MNKEQEITQDNTEEVAIEVKNLSKSFKLPSERYTSVKSVVVNPFKSRTYEMQEVLKNISFEVKKGEFFGIVGRNGSGKSTLLKLLLAYIALIRDHIQINGKLTPFIELGVGFNPELTGRENVYLNGALLGFNRKEMNALYDEIVEFAELEKFMDQKLKNYSSGMQVRLAFSIAIRPKSDILVLDEVLAVGDEAFQRKCYQYFAKIRLQKQTVILVTHSMDVVQQFCNRAMLIDKGHELEIDKPLKITQIYRELNNEVDVTVNKTKEYSGSKTKYVDAKVEYSNHGSNLKFDIHIRPKKNLEDPIVALEIFRDDGEPLIRWVTDEKLKDPIKLEANKDFKLNITLQNIFPVGFFSVRLLVRKKDRTVDYGNFNEITKFEIKNTSKYVHDSLWKPTESVRVINHKS
jgi:ABC-2 type transport system ATP-binding protein